MQAMIRRLIPRVAPEVRLTLPASDAQLPARQRLVEELRAARDEQERQGADLYAKVLAAAAARQAAELALSDARMAEHRAQVEHSHHDQISARRIASLEHDLQAGAPRLITQAIARWAERLRAERATYRGQEGEMTPTLTRLMARFNAHCQGLADAQRAAEALKLEALSPADLEARLEQLEAAIPSKFVEGT